MAWNHDQRYDSPIDEIFAWHLHKFLRDEVEVSEQVWVRCPNANYRLDFVLAAEDGRKIGVECDGKKFHDPIKDTDRDYDIILNSDIKAVYRFRGTDLFSRVHKCLLVLAEKESWLFDERSHGVIRTAAGAVDDLRDILPKIHSPEATPRLAELIAGRDANQK